MVHLRRDADVGQEQRARHRLQPSLGQGQGESPIGANPDSRRLASGGVKARGHIQGQDLSRKLVAELNQFGRASPRCTAQAVANQRINGKVCLLERGLDR